MNILHVAQIDISRASGMGRVAWHWRAELERRGHRFTHIGRKPLGREVHPAWYPMAAWAAARKLAPPPELILAHEPAAAMFAFRRQPLVVFSHGLERRGWLAAKRFRHLSGERIAVRSRLLFPVWRLTPCDHALTHAAGALVLNRQDYDFAVERYNRRPAATFQFRNGVDLDAAAGDPRRGTRSTVLFVGTWIARKGTRTLIEAATRLHSQGIRPRWLIAGSGLTAAEVLSAWPVDLHDDVEVVPTFEPGSEGALYGRATVFVLPSFFEGQPLALLQAMAAALPVIATDTCGQKDMLIHGDNGLLFAPGDSDALSDQIARCLHDDGLRSKLGAAALKSVAGRRWEVAAAEVADFVERIHLASKER